MRIALVAAVLGLVGTAFANSSSGVCLTQEQGVAIVNTYISLLDGSNPHFNQTAEKLFADGFEEISDSILILEGRPLGGAEITSKAEEIASFSQVPPVKQIETIEIGVFNCLEIIWYSNFKDIGCGKYEIKNFHLFHLNEQHQITKVFIEFSSAAWGLDTGYSFVNPHGTAYANCPA